MRVSYANTWYMFNWLLIKRLLEMYSLFMWRHRVRPFTRANRTSLSWSFLTNQIFHTSACTIFVFDEIFAEWPLDILASNRTWLTPTFNTHTPFDKLNAITAENFAACILVFRRLWRWFYFARHFLFRGKHFLTLTIGLIWSQEQEVTNCLAPLL